MVPLHQLQKQKEKGPVAALLPESSPVLTEKGMEMAKTIPKPQLPQGKTLEAAGMSHVTGHAMGLLQEEM